VGQAGRWLQQQRLLLLLLLHRLPLLVLGMLPVALLLRKLL
jgi:hypothetical protein